MAMLINIIRISFFFRITNDHLAHSIAEFSFFSCQFTAEDAFGV